MRSILFSLTLIFLSSCMAYKVPTKAFCKRFPDDVVKQNNQEKALSHPLYHTIPRHRCQIRWDDLPHWLAWALFGNDDDGLFGEEASYKLEKPNTLCKAAVWWARNPLHNICFYVLGSADKVNSGFTILSLTSRGYCAFRYTPEATTVFPSKGTGFYFALHGGKPFLSLRLDWGHGKKSDFYLGWRCRGNFGAKFQPFRN